MLLPFFIFFMMSATAQGSITCEEYRLDEKNGPFENVPLENQGLDADPELCYAISAAGMLEAFQKTHTPSQFTSVSPVAIAATTSARYKKLSRNWNYGEANKTLAHAISDGTCSRDFKMSYQNAYQIISAKEKYEHREISTLSAYENVRCAFHESGADQINQISDEIMQFLKSKTTSLDSIATAVKKVCAKHFKDLSHIKSEINFHPFQKGWDLNEDMIPLLNQALTHSPKQPVQILFRADAIFPKAQAQHSVLMIGQRINNNDCEILIRDTYGDEACKKGIYTSDVKCDKAGIWVKRSKMLLNTYSFTWLTPKK